MPIGLEDWRAGVGSSNAARSHAFGKFMRRKCPRSFLSQLISYLVALFTEGTWFASDNGEVSTLYVCLAIYSHHRASYYDIRAVWHGHTHYLHPQGEGDRGYNHAVFVRYGNLCPYSLWGHRNQPRTWM